MEVVRPDDYFVPGPRFPEFSVESECRLTLCHSFKNKDCQSWHHFMDVLIPTAMLTTDFYSDIRAATSVSFLSVFNDFTPRGVCELINCLEIARGIYDDFVIV